MTKLYTFFATIFINFTNVCILFFCDDFKKYESYLFVCAVHFFMNKSRVTDNNFKIQGKNNSTALINDFTIYIA